jgi:hypothetical protein
MGLVNGLDGTLFSRERSILSIALEYSTAQYSTAQHSTVQRQKYEQLHRNRAGTLFAICWYNLQFTMTKLGKNGERKL